MTFTNRCRYCGNTVKSGHGIPFKYLGTPILTCPTCKNLYIDKDVIEWSISPKYRKFSYYFANNRVWWCVIPYLLASAFISFHYDMSPLFSFLSCLPVFFGAFVICALYVKRQIKKEINASYERTKNQKYLHVLLNSGYPLSKQCRTQLKNNLRKEAPHGIHHQTR